MTDVFKGLPDSLKEPEKYLEVETKVLEIMNTGHHHRKIGAFIKCKVCEPKLKERREYLADVGFKDYHQYLRWKQVMDIMNKVIKLRNAKANKKEGKEA